MLTFTRFSQKSMVGVFSEWLFSTFKLLYVNTTQNRFNDKKNLTSLPFLFFCQFSFLPIFTSIWNNSLEEKKIEVTFIFSKTSHWSIHKILTNDAASAKDFNFFIIHSYTRLICADWCFAYFYSIHWYIPSFRTNHFRITDETNRNWFLHKFEISRVCMHHISKMLQ